MLINDIILAISRHDTLRSLGSLGPSQTLYVTLNIINDLIVSKESTSNHNTKLLFIQALS